MNLTPMMQQYRDAKDRHPGLLLLFRMGDFYELFEDDAKEASRILGLTLTSRDKSIPMAGFPHHALESHLSRLLRAGHRVAICDQVEDPAQAKGLVRREVTRVVTPGTLTEEALLDPRQANHLVCVWPDFNRACTAEKTPVGVAWIDLSTGTFQATDINLESLGDELGRLAPSECVFCERSAVGLPNDDFGTRLRTHAPTLTLTSRPEWNFEASATRNALYEHFKITTLAGLGFDDDQPCLTAAGALLMYLQETLKGGLQHLRLLQPFQQSRYLRLDDVTRRSLELTRTIREGGREGSLLAAMDRTVTPMGARLLCEWIGSPLLERSAIESRLDTVGELVAELGLRGDLQESLRHSPDLQRLASRVSTARATPRDLAAIARTLSLLPRIKAKITGRRAALISELENRLELCAELREAIENAIVEEPPLSPREGGLIRRGYDSSLDELHSIARGGKEWIARFQAEQITQTGIATLKVGFNRVFGYYIEITQSHLSKVPANYQRKQTLKNAERYITPELKEYEEKVLTAEEKIYQREYELFLGLRDRVALEIGRLLQTAEVLSNLDVLTSLAELAVSRNYCRPELCDGATFDIQEGRHPVLDQTLPSGTFVPNNIVLGPDQGTLLLITGPNMAGKSVYIRQVALLAIMAQVGSYVPAQRACLGIVDRIFTRVGASDEVSRAQSTFMVEMTEAANILNNATPRSLVILDEIGRGTSTYDGVSLAWAITEYLHDNIRCRALFATHYHELAQLEHTLPNLRNFNVLVHEHNGEVVFLHKIAAGSTDKSYGIHVARLAGIPQEVLQRATEVLAQLESRHLEPKNRSSSNRKRRHQETRQPSLFSEGEILESAGKP